MNDPHYIDVNGVRIAYRDQGVGPTLLLLHGLGAEGSCWDAQAKVLEASYRVIRPDFRGFGHSAKPREAAAYSVDIFADDVGALLDALDAWPAMVVGTSMGGYMALTLALKEPTRVSRLVLCHTACSRKVPAQVMAERLAALQAGNMRDYARVAIGHALHASVASDVRQRVENMLAANDQQAYLLVFGGGALDFDVCGHLEGIRMPTLVITSRDDKVVPFERSAQLAQGIAGARLVEMPDTGHLSYMERPAVFNAALSEFLAESPQ